MKPRGRLREALTRFALVLASIVVALLLLEAGLRVFGVHVATSHPLGAFHRADREIGWVGTPDVDRPFVDFGFRSRVRSNSRGLRGPEVPYERTPGKRRIVVLGDSFLWGWGVDNEQMFSQRLSEKTGAEVVTLACSSYGTIQETLLFEREGVRYRPDVVILGFFLNDMEDNVDSYAGRRPYGAMSDRGELVIENLPVRKSLEGDLTERLYDRSRAALFLADRGQRLLTGISNPLAKKGPLRRTPYVPRVFFKDPSYNDLPTKWAVTRAAIERLQRDVEATGAKLLLLIAPHPIQVMDDWKAADLQDLARKPTEIDLERPVEMLRSFAAERGIDFLDPTPWLRAAYASGQHPYFERPEFHWSPLGHDLAAGAAATAPTLHGRPDKD